MVFFLFIFYSHMRAIRNSRAQSAKDSLHMCVYELKIGSFFLSSSDPGHIFVYVTTHLWIIPLEPLRISKDGWYYWNRTMQYKSNVQFQLPNVFADNKAPVRQAVAAIRK